MKLFEAISEIPYDPPLSSPFNPPTYELQMDEGFPLSDPFEGESPLYPLPLSDSRPYISSCAQTTPSRGYTAGHSKEERREQKLLRNRVFAQQSRDRKKKELQEAKEEVERLRSENSNLKIQLEQATTELRQLRLTLNPASPSSTIKLSAPTVLLNSEKIVSLESSTRKPLPKSKNFFSLLLAALLFGWMCFTAFLSPLIFPKLPQQDLALSQSPPCISKLGYDHSLSPLQLLRRQYIEQKGKLCSDSVSQFHIIEKNSGIVTTDFLSKYFFKAKKRPLSEAFSLQTYQEVIQTKKLPKRRKGNSN